MPDLSGAVFKMKLFKSKEQNLVHYVTGVTYARIPIFRGDEICSLFIEALSETRLKDPFKLIGYVLMPDHIHFFAGFAPDAIHLSAWIKSLKNALSKSLRAAGITAPHWQKGFFDHILRSDESYTVKWDYVRMNPVRANLVRSAEEWEFQGEIFPLEP